MKFVLGMLLMVFVATAIADENVKATISNCAELQNMASNLSGDYELTQDIDCQGIYFDPIGDASAPFRGSLDGRGHAIRNLSIQQPGQENVGLFGVTYEQVNIENLTLENLNMLGGEAVGSLVGFANGPTVISNVHAQGDVQSTGGYGYVGGLIGNMVANSGTGSISDSSTHVTVRATGVGTGGLVGANNAAPITNSYTVGNVFGGQQTGGIAGNNAGTVTNSYATGNVTGLSYTGGLLGYGPAVITNSYATGDVISTSGICTGGLVGSHQFTRLLSNTYALGSVTGVGSVGGLLGCADSSLITNSYAVGRIVGQSAVGGLIGDAEFVSISSSYWDRETTGQPTSSGGGLGKTTPEMYQRATYVGWDFIDIWDIRENESYPWLRTEEDESGIRTCAQLQDMAYDLDGTYELGSDIDCAGVAFAPIGTLEQPFTGNFEGYGYTIRNLTVNREGETFIGGVWGATSGANIKNVRVEGLEVVAQQYVGGLIGAALRRTGIYNVSVEGNIESRGEHPIKGYMGGLVGLLSESFIESSAASVDINTSRESASFIGGLVGESEASEIMNSYARGSVYGHSYVGGLVGYSGGSTVENTYAAVAVSGNETTGGLIGGASTTDVMSSYWDMEVSGHAVSAGGEGKTTTEMWQQGTYLNWDFVNIWAIDENVNYPYLRSDLG